MKLGNVDFDTYFNNYPDADGYFGRYGGVFVDEKLKKAMAEITDAYYSICQSRKFIAELRRIRKEFQGRPTPISHLERLSNALGGRVQLYAKREDLNHSGAHKLNHCMGEALLAKYMGKKKVIAETGAGQHGVALATAAAYFGLECDIYMGSVDIKKQAPNVARMKILGANVVEVTHGLQTLKEAVDAAFEAYSKEYNDAIYCIGSVLGPHPFPMMVRDFQSVVGIEAREQFLDMTGHLPNAIVACVGGGSNAAGLFAGFLNDPVEIYGVEPLGRGPALGDHAASLRYGTEGVMHGFNSIMLKDENGEPAPVYSIASGLDYPSSGPEHAFLQELGRVKYDVIDDAETIDAFFRLSRLEGIIPAIESAHAVAYGMKLAQTMGHGSVLINLSGRGDKDLDYVIEHYGTSTDYSRHMPRIKNDERNRKMSCVLSEELKKRNLPRLLPREEMLDVLQREEYGFLPPAPQALRFSVQEDVLRKIAGKARCHSVTAECTVRGGKTFSFPFSAVLPTDGKQHPFFIHLNFRDCVPDRYMPTEELIDNGFAVLSFCYKDVTSDDGDFTNGLAGVLFEDGRRGPTDPGKIALWAWAAQRVMDWALTQTDVLDPSRAVVCGHSRLGKTALFTAATDPRFAFAYSNDSGCSGAAIARGKTGESVADICERFPFWFCENYLQYAGRESEMPFDQHYLIASVAPRFCMVGSASEDAWANPLSEQLCCLAASPAFKTGLRCPDRPAETGEAFPDGDLGYHKRWGTHFFSRTDWLRLIEFVRLHTKEES